MARTSTANPELDARFHRLGCPEKRIETYTEQRPKGQGEVRVIRCVDCGGQDTAAIGASTASAQPDVEGDDL